MNYFKLTVLTSAFLLALVSGVNAQYVSGDEVITANQPVELSVANSDMLIIVYRPGSDISDTTRVAVNGGTYSWMPREAGIVSLSTPNGPVQTVSVRFEDAPFWGYFIMFGAAFILFGGALYASIKLFGTSTPDEVASRPDT